MKLAVVIAVTLISSNLAIDSVGDADARAFLDASLGSALVGTGFDGALDVDLQVVRTAAPTAANTTAKPSVAANATVAPTTAKPTARPSAAVAKCNLMNALTCVTKMPKSDPTNPTASCAKIDDYLNCLGADCWGQAQFKAGVAEINQMKTTIGCASPSAAKNTTTIAPTMLKPLFERIEMKVLCKDKKFNAADFTKALALQVKEDPTKRFHITRTTRATTVNSTNATGFESLAKVTIDVKRVRGGAPITKVVTAISKLKGEKLAKGEFMIESVKAAPVAPSTAAPTSAAGAAGPARAFVSIVMLILVTLALVH